MNRKEIVLVAARDLKFLPQLAGQSAELQVEGCTTQLPQLDEGPQYWCFIDWLLPETSGIELCRELRLLPATQYAHITMLVDDDAEVKQRALKSGADDYLVVPATAADLADRIAERLRRYRSANGGVRPQYPAAAAGELMVDTAAMVVRYRDKRIVLAPNEFRLLAFLVSHPDRVFSRGDLIVVMGKNGDAIDERTVDVWIGRIRRALKAGGVPDRLRTVRSMGYIFDGSDQV